MIKRIIFTFLAFIVTTHTAYAEEIRSFTSDVTIQQSGIISVRETIDYTFTVPRHGIYREVPYLTKNQDGKEYKSDIKVVSVVDEKNGAYTYTTTDTGEGIKLKIGDAQTTLTGDKQYNITYEVAGALGYFSDHDELYWNVTGNAWEIPIQNTSVKIQLPANIPAESVQVICYTGSKGSDQKNCTTNVEKNIVTVKSNMYFSSGEGLTFAISFPKGSVAVLEPKPYTRFENTWYGKLILAIIFIILGVLAFVWYIGLPLYIPYRWYRFGRDPESQEARAWYDAPKNKNGHPLTPAETGGLVDETVDHRDIFGSLVQLAQRGYLTISETKKDDFTLIRKKENDAQLLPFESRLLNALFDDKSQVRIKDIKIQTAILDVQQKLYSQMVQNGFFNESPEAVRTRYYILGGLALMTGNIVLGIIAFLFGKNMPRKTDTGAQQAAVGRALKTFLSSQERQLTFQAKNQMMFEKLLPYAIAFGVEKIWADRFRDIVLAQPDWYTSYNHSSFNAALFANSMHRSVSSFSTAATPTRSTTGHSSGFSGGFSGGGGGGGGGGSW
jgi:hypothetical protein